MATISGATALWMHDVTGSLEPGKQADLVVFDTADFDWRPLHNPVANLVYGVTGHVETGLHRPRRGRRPDRKRLTRVNTKASYASRSSGSTAASWPRSASTLSPSGQPAPT